MVENKIKAEWEMNTKLSDMEQNIKGTKEKENRESRREWIKYNRRGSKIESRWRETEVEEIWSDKIKLKWLDLELTKEEWMWLANFRNMVKREYWGIPVEYTRWIVNRSFAYRKTLYVWNTMLISRKNLKKHIPSCDEDEVVEKIADWLNK